MKRTLFGILLGLSVVCPSHLLFSDNAKIAVLDAEIADLQKKLGAKKVTVRGQTKTVIKRPTKFDRDYEDRERLYRRLKAAEQERDDLIAASI